MIHIKCSVNAGFLQLAVIITSTFPYLQMCYINYFILI